MNPILRNVLSVVAAIFVGMGVNMGIIMIGSALVPPPAGVDVNDMQSIVDNIHLYQPKHFLVPFFAHALGTLASGFLVVKLAVSHKMKFALGMGVLFLFFGIMAVNMIPAPMWFNILDLVVAYIPMAFLGGRLGIGRND